MRLLNIALFILLLCSFHADSTEHSVKSSTISSRIQIKDINQVLSAQSVGTLVITRNRFSKDTQSLCTGILIADDYLMTAAHCIIDHMTGEGVLNAEFIPQYLGDGKQIRSRVFIEKGWVHKKYLTTDYKDILQFKNGLVSLNRKPNTSDLAILKVTNSQTGFGLGKQYGYVAPIAAEDVLTTKKPNVSLLSYPADKSGNTLWYQQCHLTEHKSLIGKFDCQIYSGSSGAGLLIKAPNSDKDRVLGIVSSSSDNGLSGAAVLFSTEMIQDIQNIIKNRTELIKHFSAVKFKTTPRTYVHIENLCKKEIIAMVYSEENNQGMVSESKIPVNTSVIFNSIQSRIWYSHIRDLEGKPYNFGNDILLDVNNKSYYFKRNIIPYKNIGNGSVFYGDYFLKVYCI